MTKIKLSEIEQLAANDVVMGPILIRLCRVARAARQYEYAVKDYVLDRKELSAEPLVELLQSLDKFDWSEDV